MLMCEVGIARERKQSCSAPPMRRYGREKKIDICQIYKCA
jgi:hypothetical protein